ncbi:hypothetical protein ACTXT7_013197 [Hymenolepis weldensis]
MINIQQSIYRIKKLFEDPKHLEVSIASLSSAPASYSIKLSASAEIPDPVPAEDVTNNFPEFICDSKFRKFFESWHNKYKSCQMGMEKQVLIVSSGSWVLSIMNVIQNSSYTKNSINSVTLRQCRSWKRFLARTSSSSTPALIASSCDQA